MAHVFWTGRACKHSDGDDIAGANLFTNDDIVIINCITIDLLHPGMCAYVRLY